MANVKITELTAATALAGTDVLPIVDVGADATKKVSVSDLLRNLPDGSAANPSLAFADDQNTGVLSPGDNSLAFATSGTQRLVIDSSGNVGIGDSSPSEKLSVAGKISFIGTESAFGSSSQPTIYRSGSSAGSYPFDNFGHLIFQPRADGAPRDVIFATGNGGANKTVIDSSGRLLVGSSAARSNFFNSTFSAGLQLEGTGSARRAAIIGADGNANLILARQQSGAVGGNTPPSNGHLIGSVSYQGNDGAQFVAAADISAEVDGTPGTNDMPGRLVFSTTADGASSPTERLRIDSSGRLLLGTTTEGYPDADNFTVADSGNCGITIRSGTTSEGAIYFSDGTSGNAEYKGYFLYDHDGDYLRIGTAAVERMRIDSSGRLLIGTTATSVHGDRLIEIGSTSRSATYQAITTSTSGTGGIVFADTTTNDNGGYRGIIQYAHSSDSLQFSTAATERVRIDSSGRIGLGATPTAQFTGHSLFQIGAQASLGANQALSTTGQTYLTHNLYFDTSGNYKVFNTSSANEGSIIQLVDGSIRFRTSAATTGTPSVGERVRIDANGLKFNGDTAAANALDDYEEGTFTPGLVNGSNSSVYSSGTRYGFYTKIGRLVTATAVFDNATVTAGNDIRIADLPFTVTSTTSRYPGFNSHTAGSALSGTDVEGGYARQGEARFQLLRRGSTSGVNFSAGNLYIFLTMIYVV